MAHILNTTNSYLKNGSAPPTPTTPLSSNRTIPGTFSTKIHQERGFFILEESAYGRVLTLNNLLGTKITDGWTEYIHPEGNTYFYHKEWRVVTEADMLNPEVTKKVEFAYLPLVEMWNEVNAKDQSLGDIREEGLEIFIGLDTEVKYYFVDHQTQKLFWLTEITLWEGFWGPMDVMEGVTVATSDLLFRQQFYAHLAAFPCHNQSYVPEDGGQFLRGYLQLALLDDLTKGFNLTPWDSPQVEMLWTGPDRLLNAGPNKMTDGFKIFFISGLLVAACLSSSSFRLSIA
ncbi:unnamed protein product [Cyclocybe aegerita]|uniref:Uncharacterized protein n=1 Tax=Cyclocybe aegerita TaxID=1973307 RepID=A0A8S0WHN8_CYCAE|nr:unnamed protein product [Cyclocybe aegerita]